MNDFDTTEFEKEPVLGIVRGVKKDSLKGILDAAVSAGLRFLEITLNTKNAPDLIKTASGDFNICIGAGTVLSLQDARTAYDAGARFLVSPTLNEEVAGFCRDKKIPYFPGAFTPTEIERAWNSGATMVKIFPASRLGPEFIREVLGPFPKIKLLAVGGVTIANIRQYLLAGASGLAFGGSIFSINRMDTGDYETISKELKKILLVVRDI